VLEVERNRILVQLAGAIAHKLKQPLAVAWGYMELVLDDPRGDLTPTTLLYLREIDASLRSIDEIVNKLQLATLAHTREYPGNQHILDLDELPTTP
jgi:two-component system cell cycle response regulator